MACSRWRDGCTSLTVFGTTGEGASLGLNERNRALGAIWSAPESIPAKQLVIGIAAASVEDAIAQGRAGLMLGCPSFLLAPPFYFKSPGDEGLFDWLAAVLTGLGPKAKQRHPLSHPASHFGRPLGGADRSPEEGVPGSGQRREGLLRQLGEYRRLCSSITATCTS